MAEWVSATLDELTGQVNLLQNRVDRLTEELHRTQAVLNQALDALARLGQPLDVRAGNEPPDHLKAWKMKPLDE